MLTPFEVEVTCGAWFPEPEREPRPVHSACESPALEPSPMATGSEVGPAIHESVSTRWHGLVTKYVVQASGPCGCFDPFLPLCRMKVAFGSVEKSYVRSLLQKTQLRVAATEAEAIATAEKILSLIRGPR